MLFGALRAQVDDSEFGQLPTVGSSVLGDASPLRVGIGTVGLGKHLASEMLDYQKALNLNGYLEKVEVRREAEKRSLAESRVAMPPSQLRAYQKSLRAEMRTKQLEERKEKNRKMHTAAMQEQNKISQARKEEAQTLRRLKELNSQIADTIRKDRMTECQRQRLEQRRRDEELKRISDEQQKLLADAQANRIQSLHDSSVTSHNRAADAQRGICARFQEDALLIREKEKRALRQRQKERDAELRFQRRLVAQTQNEHDIRMCVAREHRSVSVMEAKDKSRIFLNSDVIRSQREEYRSKILQRTRAERAEEQAKKQRWLDDSSDVLW